MADDFSDEYESDFDNTLEGNRDVLKKTVHHLGLGKFYSPSWGREAAFREFFQNW